MNESVPDFPTYVEQTEPIWQRNQDQLAFDITDEAVDVEIKKLMIELEEIHESSSAKEIRNELESILEFKDDFPVLDNWDAIEGQKREIKKLA